MFNEPLSKLTVHHYVVYVESFTLPELPYVSLFYVKESFYINFYYCSTSINAILVIKTAVINQVPGGTLSCAVSPVSGQ